MYHRDEHADHHRPAAGGGDGDVARADPQLFSSDPAVRELGAGLLLFAAAYRLFDSVADRRRYGAARLPGHPGGLGHQYLGLLAVRPAVMLRSGLGTPWGEPLGVRGFWIGMVVAIALAATLIGWRLIRISARVIRQPGLYTPAITGLEIHDT